MYMLYDDYDFEEEFLGQFDTMREVRAACRERDKDTDGEWSPLLTEKKTLFSGNVGTEHYCIVYDWHY